MEKLNELVELAKKATSGEWIADSGEGWDAIISQKDMVNGNFIVGEFIGPDSKANKDFVLAASPEKILAIAEAFRALLQRAEAAEAKLAELQKQQLIIPEGLNRYTAELVLDFSKAIAEKLHQSEFKYGWSDGWKESDWQDKCLADFHHHISKGDPRDVAAYCAFMWHHEWPTRPAPAADLAELVPPEATTENVHFLNHVEDEAWVIGANWMRAAILRNIEEAK